MIDWVGLATNGIWILGSAILMATLSYADWLAMSNSRASHTRMRTVLGQPEFRTALWSGLAIFCVGVALSGGRWWERVLWGVLSAMAALEIWRAGQAMRAPARAPSPDTSRRTNQT